MSQEKQVMYMPTIPATAGQHCWLTSTSKQTLAHVLGIFHSSTGLQQKYPILSAGVSSGRPLRTLLHTHTHARAHTIKKEAKVEEESRKRTRGKDRIG